MAKHWAMRRFVGTRNCTFFCLFTTIYAYANIQNIDYIFIYIYVMQYKCNDERLHLCILPYISNHCERCWHVFLRIGGGCCLKSWNKIEIDKQILATTKLKSERPANIGWPSSKDLVFFFGDHKSHPPGNKKCVAPASSTKFD